MTILKQNSVMIQSKTLTLKVKFSYSMYIIYIGFSSSSRAYVLEKFDKMYIYMQ